MQKVDFTSETSVLGGALTSYLGGDVSELDSDTGFAYLLPRMKHGGGEVIPKSLQVSS